MLPVFRNLNKFPYLFTARLATSYFSQNRGLCEIGGNNFIYNYHTSSSANSCPTYDNKFLRISRKTYEPLLQKRNFSKKKGSKRNVEEEESDSDEEEPEETVDVVEDFGDNIIKKNVPSLRIDTVMKAALGLSKKKIEQDFYSFKLRINGEKVVKKSLNVHVGDEIDRVRGFSPDTSRFLIVDRIIIKGTDKLTGSGMYPLKMEVLKSLTVENYEDAWNLESENPVEK